MINKVDNANDIKEYLISLSFNDKQLFSNEMSSVEGDFLKKIENIYIEESGVQTEDRYGESDAFMESNKSDFKDNTILLIKYCYNTGNCETEQFVFDYKD